MVESTINTITDLARKPIAASSEAEIFIDLLPDAVLLVDRIAQKFLYANDSAVSLTGYSNSDLTKLEWNSLFQNWVEGIAENALNEEAPTVEIICRDHSIREVKLTSVILPPKGRQGILLLKPVASVEVEKPEFVRWKRLWDLIQDLIDSTHNSDLTTSLDEALNIGHKLTDAAILAVYKADEQRPSLHCCASRGEVENLPVELPAHDLAQLGTPEIWIPGKRPTTNLQRFARAGQLAYLTVVPLGEPKAFIGLLAAGGYESTPPDDHLQILQLLGSTLTTIIQQKLIVEQLNNQVQRQISILQASRTVDESIKEGYLLLSPGLLIQKINPAAEKILGYASREVLGQQVDHILIGTEPLLPAILSAQQGKAIFLQGNVRLYRRHGESFLASLHSIPVFNGERLEAIVILVQDLSEQEQIQAHAQQLEQRANLGNITATFAHEVRNPINNISTGLELMSFNLPGSDPNQEILQRMQQDCDRLTELMKSVLAYARPTDYEMQPLELSQLVQRLMDRLHSKMVRVNVKPNIQIESKCPLIEGNFRALEQVFNNLINNAIEAMSEVGGSLVIRIQPYQSQEGCLYVEVSIADTGPGIPTDLQEQVFQPFFTTNRNGTGLGLAIAKRIVTAHKGTIQLTSFPGGTVFQVLFPALAPPVFDRKIYPLR